MYTKPGIKRGRNSVPLVQPDKEKLMRSEELAEELLPGIPNEITLAHIIPKLPWRTFFVLSSVCRGWKQAGYRYYDERVRSNSTETLAVVNVTVCNNDSQAIALYSVRDERFYYVPPIPCFRGFPSCFKCVAVDGKLYVLGGILDPKRELLSKEVYVLDLVGLRRWRQCASMIELRHEFGCAVMDGKIYVFGGDLRDRHVVGAEVYDPKLNSWSRITYNGVARRQHRVLVVGEEFVLHGGWSRFPDYEITDDDQNSLEFYNPVTEEYREIFFCDRDFDPFEETMVGIDIVSGAQGKFYSISFQDIYAHHIDDYNSSTYVGSFSTQTAVPPHSDILEPFIVEVVDDELLGVVWWNRPYGSCLIRSRGYNTENSQMSWEKAPFPLEQSSTEIWGIHCSIQL